MTIWVVVGTTLLLMWVVCSLVLGRARADAATPRPDDSSMGWPTEVWLLLAVACAPVFVAALAQCAFVHPFADDYVNAVRARDMGFWGVQAHVYQTWTGRFTAAALISLPAASGSDLKAACRVIGALDLLALLSGALALAAAVGPLAWRGVRPACAAVVLVVILLDGLDSPAESLYWATSTVTYMAPVGMTLWILAALAGSRRWRRAPRLAAQSLASASAFLVAGLVEVVWVPVLGVLLLVMLGVRRAGGPWRPYAAAAVLFGLGALVSAAAPGNSARQLVAGGGGSLEFTMRVGLFGAIEQVSEWIRSPVLTCALIAFAPTCAALGRTLICRAADVLAAALLLFGSLTATWAATAWGVGADVPPSRVLGTAWVMFLTGLFGLAVVSAAAFPRWRSVLAAVPTNASYAAAALLTLGVWVGQGGRYVTDLGTAPSYDAFLEAREDTVRRANPGGRAAVERVPSALQTLVHAPMLDLSADAQDFKNTRMAAWYGAGAVVITDPLGR